MKRKSITVNLIQTMSQGTKLRQENLFLSSLHCDDLGQEFLDKIRLAYRLAKIGHSKQLRDNGEPYFSHLCGTTGILVNELGNRDCDLICACLLHDVWEDTENVSLDLIEALFGREVRDLVVVVSKPKRTDQRFSDDRARHEFYFAQLIASGTRAKLLKLCDRLHAVRTLWNCHPSKLERKIKETEVIYLPFIKDICQQYAEEARYLKKQFAFSLQSLALCPNRSK